MHVRVHVHVRGAHAAGDVEDEAEAFGLGLPARRGSVAREGRARTRPGPALPPQHLLWSGVRGCAVGAWARLADGVGRGMPRNENGGEEEEVFVCRRRGIRKGGGA